MPHRWPDAVGAEKRIGDVQVWTVALDRAADDIVAARAVLSDDERARADRFRFDLHRRRFVAARAALRLVLGRALDRDPASLQFRYAARGKPSLADDSGPALPFNLSHCDDLAIIAAGGDRPLGVDVERIRPLMSMDAIATEYFSAREVDLMLADPPDHPRAFFRHWTIKEAWLKADGIGLGGLARDVEVSGDGPALLHAAGGAALPYDIHEWSPRDGFLAALAIGRSVTAEELREAARR